MTHALISCGLQDLSDAQVALVVGLVAQLTRKRLSDEIAASLRRIMFVGYAVLGHVAGR